MSESDKINEDGLYYITFAVVVWCRSLCRCFYKTNLSRYFHGWYKVLPQKKGLKIYCFCLMSNHVYFIPGSFESSLSNILCSFKSYTAKALMAAIAENSQENRKELFLYQFNYYGKKNKNQFWKHDNLPFYLYSKEMVEQKVNYIHNNPVATGFVNEAHEWRLRI